MNINSRYNSVLGLVVMSLAVRPQQSLLKTVWMFTVNREKIPVSEDAAQTISTLLRGLLQSNTAKEPLAGFRR